ncbi:hypothetical protein WJ05_04640 [Burkholderia vietnamiensis]|nr:hypothetical protein WJ05_04640 [Burkholderia vietnamiensis]
MLTATLVNASTSIDSAANSSMQTNSSGTDATPASAGTSIAASRPSCASPVTLSRSGDASGLHVAEASQYLLMGAGEHKHLVRVKRTGGKRRTRATTD